MGGEEREEFGQERTDGGGSGSGSIAHGGSLRGGVDDGSHPPAYPALPPFPSPPEKRPKSRATLASPACRNQQPVASYQRRASWPLSTASARRSSGNSHWPSRTSAGNSGMVCLGEKPPMSMKHDNVASYLGAALINQLDSRYYRVNVNGAKARLTARNSFVPDVVVIPAEYQAAVRRRSACLQRLCRTIAARRRNLVAHHRRLRFRGQARCLS